MPKVTIPRDVTLDPVSFRLSPEMRQRLRDAAGAQGRSLTSEIEYRLRRSLELDELRAIVREEVVAGIRDAVPPWEDLASMTQEHRTN